MKVTVTDRSHDYDVTFLGNGSHFVQVIKRRLTGDGFKHTRQIITSAPRRKRLIKLAERKLDAIENGEGLYTVS